MTTTDTVRPPSRRRPARRRLLAPLALTVLAATACGSTNSSDQSAPTSTTGVSVENCGEDVRFPDPAERLYVYDGGMISMVLSIGAADAIAGISGLQDDAQALARAYGEDVVDALPVASAERPTLENVLAQRPDAMVAGWNYGWDEDAGLTPDGLADRDIAGYTLTESCRQGAGDARGVVEPWQALTTDLTNLGRITGHQKEATARVADIETRLAQPEQAPQAENPPTVFLFDSGTSAPFTSGSFGGPQGIIEAAGARNATEDVADTWTTVSWERVVASQPDYIAFVDYPGQSYEEKVAVLRANPSTRDLPAVEEGRFLNLPYAAWVSGPLNIDAAEQLRASLEEADLLPSTGTTPQVDLKP
ncbi:ABC transporter substrate-binding protein [Nocardioides sp. AX2bis]|uniref:ABC transporter substrate-binding protein n=1 Tax=Nocardioides sp. AX2bis TaxID=2653157 RepID=UPI0012EF562C|nr:ABC transporter substrate-binding protein [Nocardioides sp. AX2bis]VXC47816.1 Iron transporter [Nocardioides sp. AX2bis]